MKQTLITATGRHVHPKLNLRLSPQPTATSCNNHLFITAIHAETKQRAAQIIMLTDATKWENELTVAVGIRGSRSDCIIVRLLALLCANFRLNFLLPKEVFTSRLERFISSSTDYVGICF